MADDVFDKLGKGLVNTAEQLQEIYEKTTIQTIDITAQNMKKNLIRGSGSKSLNAHIVEPKPVYIKGKLYERTIDWDDQTIVNEDKGTGWGIYANVSRAPKKRNYSLRPATYHDLAYIINYGRGAAFSQDKKKVVIYAGNNFINKAVRNNKNWRKKRDKLFKQEVDLLGNKLK